MSKEELSIIMHYATNGRDLILVKRMTSCKCTGGRRGRYRLVVGFITTYELSACLSPLML